jgi:hypothetical protein
MYTQEQIIEKFKKVHGDRYDYSNVVFTKTINNVSIICPIHGEFLQSPHAHLKGQGCPKCGIEKRSKSKTHTTEQFIEKATTIHGNKYDYSKVEYKNTDTKVCIICPEHGEFFQTPHDHISNGNGCPLCGNKNKGVKLTREEFIEKSNAIHNNKYDYSKSSYANANTPTTIICPKHGEFLQLPTVHMAGHNCPECAKESRIEKQTSNTEIFIEKAKKVHGNKYDYSKVNYIRGDVPVEIICKEHGSFFQKPFYHLDGCGCQKCASLYSNYENEMADFIESLVGKENVIRNDRIILLGNELDVYIPSKKIAFEFDGLFWHSEIKKPNKNYHLEKTKMCEDKGIQLIHIFEDEWAHKNYICKSRIKNILGLNENHLYAKDCELCQVDDKTAKDFLISNHIQGYVPAKFNLALKYNDEIVSLMTFGNLRKNLGRKSSEGSWELLRFCNKIDTSVVGGASRLMKNFIKINNPKMIISYADRRWSNGNLYEKIGFDFIHNSQPNYYYVIGDERKHRFGFRKDILVSKYGCLPTDTEHNFCLSKGWYRIYDCGSKLYEWKEKKEN